MNLHLLRIFTAVAELRSFSRAAGTLYISQPAVSKGVAELERQLGTPLLDRSQRLLSLTDAGELLYRHAQQLFASERAAEMELTQLRGLAQGRLTIGASSTIGIYLLPALLGAFHRRHPGVQLFLDIGNTRDIVERLRTAPLDVAFVEGPADGADLEVTPWSEDQLVAIAAPDHPLTRLQPLALEHLLAQPLIMREPGSGTREVVDAAVRAYGSEPHAAMELGSTEAIKQAVAAGLGLAIVSAAALSAELALGRLAVLDVRDLDVRRPLTRVRVAGRPTSHALAAFLALSSTATNL